MHFSEAIRTIRSSILLSDMGEGTKVIAVTSSVPGEGKSTVAFNLAVAMSQTVKTVFVECDMRRPKLAQHGTGWKRRGLAEVLAGRAGIADCLVQFSGSKLDILTAGSVPRDPLEMLSSAKFEALIEQLSTEYEVIVLDTPPVAVVSDAMMASSLATGIVFVLRAGSTPRKLIRRSLSLLSAGAAPVLGVVLNHLDFRKAEGYYGEYSGQHSSDYSSPYRNEAAALQRRALHSATAAHPGV